MTTQSVASTDREVVAPRARRAVQSIPTSRIVRIELRKMFDTRSGFWLLTSIGVLSVVATAAAITFAPDEQLSYTTFAAAIGLPLSVILPMIAVLAVTSEWSQRSGLTTFTLVPSRERVIGAKAVATIGVGVVSMLVALAIGAIGNLAGSAIAGIDTVWNISAATGAQVVLGNVVGMAIGFTLGVVLRNSSAAIVGYFVVSFVLSIASTLLANVSERYTDLQPWVDWNYTQVLLFDGEISSAEEWAQLASTTMLWIVIPLIIGMGMLRRSEVK